jgi:hypothetical protein
VVCGAFTHRGGEITHRWGGFTHRAAERGTYVCRNGQVGLTEFQAEKLSKELVRTASPYSDIGLLEAKMERLRRTLPGTKLSPHVRLEARGGSIAAWGGLGSHRKTRISNTITAGDQIPLQLSVASSAIDHPILGSSSSWNPLQLRCSHNTLHLYCDFHRNCAVKWCALCS